MEAALSEAIHDKFRSKKFIKIMNHLHLCTSYDEVERINTVLVQHTIYMAGFYFVQGLPSIVPHDLVHGAMDNLITENTQFLELEEAKTLCSCYFKTLKILNFATNFKTLKILNFATNSYRQEVKKMF